jgi:asparagine synthase (glutamine-hydrolysing)
MCGIAGALTWTTSPDCEAVRRMTSQLSHRGPDGEGYWHDGPIALGHRRLAIIDLSASGRQPMTDVDGRCSIVFNGEIYNFQELRQTLERDGARFASHTDTEVILESYKRWDLECLERLNGMFAFALWDAPRRRLLLARDRLGEKPLFYQTTRDGGIVFASELSALRQHPSVESHVDPAALGQFLSLGYVLSPSTLFAGVRQLEPAQALLAEAAKPPRVWLYWDLAAQFRKKPPYRSEDEAAEALGAAVDRAVRMRLVSDVPLGAFLSGGLDSSTMVAAMNAARPASQNHTFSVGFGERTFDELPEARAVSKALGVRHQDAVIHPDMSAELPRIASFMDEPLADTSTIPTYFLARFAREHVTVCLSGDGGDENFAGYDTYVADRLRALTTWVPDPLARAAGSLLQASMPVRFHKVGLDEKVRRFVSGHTLDARRAHYAWRLIASDEDKLRLLRTEVREAVTAEDPFDRFDAHFRAVADLDALDQALYVDLKTWLPDDILVKVDRMTMAHSLESRAPFLDPELVGFAAGLPSQWKLKGWRKKHILKRSQTHRLPAHTLKRAKRGFNAPVSHWMNGPLGDVGRDAFRTGRLDEWFDPTRVDSLWTEHRQGRADRGLALFELTCLGLWRARTAATL